ncbi:winged helix-turn-helix domain-containing protein [Rhodopseudomonas sp. B29]|uniref:ATP-binding protein n=1 Tax=Rhodopseudomonas sp. B29 TaxID=95607 RepID=UPI0003493EE2|nr:winged helix-turn-helix domain-containing protein [Rhodopseudomonas sp. B29]
MTKSQNETAVRLAFDTFLLFPGARQLKRDGKIVSIGDKALDLLIALAERPGQILSKAELAATVWRREWVEDVTIRVTVTMLRKVLGRTPAGADYIVNSLNRGYAFSGAVDVRRWPGPGEPVEFDRATDNSEPGRLPALLKPVIGRGRDIELITGLLDQHRLVTIVGPGGIGKTTTAISSVSRLAETQGGVCFVDFGPIYDPALVPGRVAVALGSDRSGADPLGSALSNLSETQRLLVLDNCEHIAAAAAEIVERILRNAPRVKIIATSREPLRADGEVVHRLDGLTCPVQTLGITAAEAAGFSAIELFVERAQAASPHFVLTDASAPDLAEICRRLDGIALAIQLAASRVATLGVAGVLSHLDSRLRLFGSGPRTATPRHRTLEAAFEWSYELLTPIERRLFTRLSIFCGVFAIDAAVAISGGDGIAEDEIVATIANLVDKSLIVFDGNEREPRYRMLETVRVFAGARLQAADEMADVSERHARHVIARCEEFRLLDLSTGDRSLGKAARDGLDDLRSALRWAFEVPGRDLARELVFAALPPLTRLGLTFEFKTWIARALDAESEPRGRLDLSLALGKAVHLLQSEPITQSRLYGQAYESAKELGDIPGALQALWGMATTGQALHRPRQLIDAATQFYDFAVLNDQLPDAMVAESLIAFGLHDIGAFSAAEDRLRDVLQRYSPSDGVRDSQRYLFNYYALSLGWLASVEWRTGRPDDAAKTAALAVAEAGHHVPSLFVVLSHAACPIALDGSDWQAAARYIEEIYRHCGHHMRWRRWADALSAILAIRRDNASEALDKLEDALSDTGNQFPGQHFWYALQLIEAHLTFGHAARAELLTRNLCDRIRDREEYWLVPEVDRILSGPASQTAQCSGTDRKSRLARLQESLWADVGAMMSSRTAPACVAWDALPGGTHRLGSIAMDSWSSKLLAYPRSDHARQRIAGRRRSVAASDASAVGRIRLAESRTGMEIQSSDEASRKPAEI